MAQPLTPTKSRSVLGATELTLLAPLKRGLIPALDSRGYQSRAALVAATLHALGVSRREIDPTPAIPEVADAIRGIRSFRISVLGSEELQQRPQVLLSVSFDGGWEPYMRRIWRPLGPLLDLIFCNCEGYLLSTQHGFPAYAAWVRQAQVETGFYYEASPLTVSDLHLLADEKGLPAPAPASVTGSLQEQARAAMVGLYRLSDMFPDIQGSAEADIPRQAAMLLLGDITQGQPPPAGWARTASEEAAWAWFQKASGPTLAPRPMDEVRLGNVQAGILEPYADLQQGLLALVGLEDAKAVRQLIAHLKPQILDADAPPYKRNRPLFVNLAFTYQGLVLAGVDAGTLGQLSPEFREGMAARASILGDREHNHPLHWRLPLRLGSADERVALSEVHAVVSFWLADANAGLLDQARQALSAALGKRGQVLAVQAMQRVVDAKSKATSGHFGFVDGISQPTLRKKGSSSPDDVAPGELLLGYRNDRGDLAVRGRLCDESTYLVVRKLRQDVQAFADLQLNDDAKGQLMGRKPDGKELINGTQGNAFDYTADPAGAKCPLFAHIRRANPRSTRPGELDHIPRIVRRGMSYGPETTPQGTKEYGLVFMAYNASIAEQFEVIQGWLSGGNAAGPGSFSGLRDPFLGVARQGDPRAFPTNVGPLVLPADRPLVTLEWGLYAFVPSLSALDDLSLWASERELEDRVEDVDNPSGTDDPDAVQRIRDRRLRETARQAAVGSELIARLQMVEKALGFDAAVEHWKLALEDLGSRMKGHSQAVWTAVRRAHGGALRTPYGVLVCSQPLVEQVLTNAQGNYSVSGYNTRLDKSFGPIYLGRDYPVGRDRVADAANKAIMAISEVQAFGVAYGHTQDLLRAYLNPLGAGAELAVDVKDLVDELLARCCQTWFGLPDGQFVVKGGWHWRDEATCPGHFHSPSRYTFQPQPGEKARQVGEFHGQLLLQQVTQFVGSVRGSRAAQGSLGAELFAIEPDNQRLATLVIGVMMGFLPTVDGNLRGLLFEWVQDRSLWDHQTTLRRAGGGGTLAQAKDCLRKPLETTLHLRPVPEVIWRTALHADMLGPVDVRAGDTVVLSLVSALQENLMEGKRCPHLLFGGERRQAGTPPTHACPGQSMAMGVMLGFLAALLDTVELRPALSPMALRIRA